MFIGKGIPLNLHARAFLQVVSPLHKAKNHQKKFKHFALWSNAVCFLKTGDFVLNEGFLLKKSKKNPKNKRFIKEKKKKNKGWGGGGGI